MANFKYKKNIYLYVISFILMLTMGIYLKKSLSNRLVAFDDKEQVMQYSSNSIPVRINLYSKRWGEIDINSAELLKQFWSIVDSMPRSKNFYDSRIENSESEIIGNIFYLDGKKSTLYLDNNLRINDDYYGGEKSSAYISRLKNFVSDIFCTPKILASLVNDKNKIIIVDKFDKTNKCGSNDKILVRNGIIQLKRIRNNNRIEKAICNKGTLNYHIRIYREYLNESHINISKLKQDNYDIISIDIYENNYVIIRDYGDEIVKSFYMEGNLNEICKSIFKK